MVIPTAIANISWKYYPTLAILNTAFAPILHFFVQTKCKTLEDLNIYFAERFHPRRGGGGGEELRAIEQDINQRYDDQVLVKSEETQTQTEVVEYAV